MENFQAGFEERLAAALEPYPGFDKAGTRPPVFLAALSGGADSTALAAALGAIRDSAAGIKGSGSQTRPPFILRCLHVNHNIRGREECFADERHVISLCKTLSIPLRIHRIRPGAVKAYARAHGTGIEAAARRFRYDALREEALRVGAGAILVAHTRDDLLETILMAVLRGAGPAGLGAMASEGGGPPASVPIARPFLGITRAEVESYLAGRGLSYTTDASNSDTRFLRNRIRRVLVPLLDREFPHWQAPLLSLNKTQALVAGFLASEASRRLPWNREGKILFLEEKDFFAQSPAVREEALFQALDTLCREPFPAAVSGSAAPGFTAAPGDFRPKRAALRPFAAGEKAACDLGSFRLEKKGGRITAEAQKDSTPGRTPRAFSVLIKSPGLYKLETLTLRVFRADAMTEQPVSSRGFFASFPLAARSLERERVEVRDRDGRAAIVNLQGEIVWVRKGGSRNGSCIVVETAAPKPAGE